MRHVSRPHPVLRARLLLIVGNLRLRRLRLLLESRMARRRDHGGCPSSGTVSDDPGCDARAHERALRGGAREALAAALRVSCLRGGHDWRLMADACKSLALLWAEGSDAFVADGGEGDTGDPSERMSPEAGIGTMKVRSSCERLLGVRLSRDSRRFTRRGSPRAREGTGDDSCAIRPFIHPAPTMAAIPGDLSTGHPSHTLPAPSFIIWSVTSNRCDTKKNVLIMTHYLKPYCGRGVGPSRELARSRPFRLPRGRTAGPEDRIALPAARGVDLLGSSAA